jgi:hypothetical protein
VPLVRDIFQNSNLGHRLEYASVPKAMCRL